MRCVRVWVSETKRVVKSDERKEIWNEKREKKERISSALRERERERESREKSQVRCNNRH